MHSGFQRSDRQGTIQLPTIVTRGDASIYKPIESKPPGGDSFFPLNNRVAFSGGDGSVNPLQLSTLVSPIQKFRWVHFPFNADRPGAFTYSVTPVFMDADDQKRVKENYGRHYERLVSIKRKYDGDNVFHMNQNIKP